MPTKKSEGFLARERAGVPFFYRIGNFSKLTITKNAGLAFFLGAIVAFPGEVLSSLERLRTFFYSGILNNFAIVFLSLSL